MATQNQAPDGNSGQYTVQGAMRSLGFQTIADASTVQTLTVPEGATVALIQATGNNANWRDDGTNAAVTASTGGMLLTAGASPITYWGDLSAFTVIESVAASTASINITYYG